MSVPERRSPLVMVLMALIATILLAGVSAGSFLAHHVPARRLQQGVAALMIVVGVLVTVRAITP